MMEVTGFMKKKLVVMCMLFITCVVTSCSGNNNGKTEADNIQTQTFPQQYRYSSEHLRIDLQEITPQEVSWKNGTATECSLDYEKVGRVFMPDDGSNTLDAEAQMISSNAVSDGVSESFFTWGLDSCTYTDLEYLELNACLKTDRFYSDYNLSEYTDSKEFTFASEEAAKQEIYEIMDSCGIDLKKDFTCETYYLDHEILQQQEEHIDMDGNQQEEEYKTASATDKAITVSAPLKIIIYLILPNWILTNGFRQLKPQAANSPYSQPRMKPASDCGKVT